MQVAKIMPGPFLMRVYVTAFAIWFLYHFSDWKTLGLFMIFFIYTYNSVVGLLTLGEDNLPKDTQQAP